MNFLEESLVCFFPFVLAIQVITTLCYAHVSSFEVYPSELGNIKQKKKKKRQAEKLL